MIPIFDDTTPYIWAAYGFAAIILCGLTLRVFARAAEAKRRLDAAEREESQIP